MKKLKSIFCQTYRERFNSDIHHIDEIHFVQFSGRELFNFCDLYAGRAEAEYGKQHRRKAFLKGMLYGIIVAVIIYFFTR